jgi:protein O-GlcNAc transferase
MRAKRRSRTIPELLALALSHHQAGRLGEAEAGYEKILRLEPDHADALNLLGLAAHHKGQTEMAIALITRATRKDPRVASYFFNLGLVFEKQGEVEKAIAHFRHAAFLDPDLAHANNNAGTALLKQGKFSEAAVSFSRELSIRPESHETISNLGIALHKSGKCEQAIVCYQKALSLNPGYAIAHNNLGMTFDRLGRSEEAIASYNQALLCNPDCAEAYSNLGNTLVSRSDLDEAVRCYQRALELQPELHAAHLNLGNANRELGLLNEAVSNYQHAIFLAPDNASVHSTLALTFNEQGKLQEAAESFQRAIECRPALASAYSTMLYFYAFTRHISPAAERTLAEGWEKSVLSDDERAAARRRAPPGSGAFPVRSRQGRPLRLGIVSAELGSHAVGHFLLPLLGQLDRSRFHLSLFPTLSKSGACAQEFRDLADSYLSLTELSDGAAADRIRLEQIDVLMDTTGHTLGGRLGIFAHRAAPVQCTYIGYWGTTGLTEMDWFIGDPHYPRSMDAHFSEGIWRMPRLIQCYQGEHSLPESGWVPDETGTIWLGSFNKLSKIRERTLGLWARVLHALPEAKLIFEDGARHAEETHQRILSTLSHQGIAEERVTFIPFVPGHERHMALYDRLDIALDTIPFNSGTTAFDTLWMGVPLVALEGNWSGGMMASSILKAFDRTEWIARDEAEYVSIVCTLARDLEGRKNQRKSQRSRMLLSPLCDPKATARSMEDALEGMYDRWSQGRQALAKSAVVLRH